MWNFEQQLKWLTSARRVSSRYEHLQKPRNISTVIPGLCRLIIASTTSLLRYWCCVYMTPLPFVPMKHWKFRVFISNFPENFICKEIPNKWFILQFAICDGWVHNANHQIQRLIIDPNGIQKFGIRRTPFAVTLIFAVRGKFQLEKWKLILMINRTARHNRYCTIAPGESLISRKTHTNARIK